jgi:hypothetical protein
MTRVTVALAAIVVGVAVTLQGCGSSDCTWTQNGVSATMKCVGSSCCSALQLSPADQQKQMCSGGKVCTECGKSDNDQAKVIGSMACMIPVCPPIAEAKLEATRANRSETMV